MSSAKVFPNSYRNGANDFVNPGVLPLAGHSTQGLRSPERRTETGSLL